MGNLLVEFKTSDGWLQRFRSRHMIGFRQISGESASVITPTTDKWKHRLQAVVKGYNDDDVCNADETEFLFRALSDQSLVLRKEDCTADKCLIERYTILLCPN